MWKEFKPETYLLDVALVPGQPVRLGHDRVPDLGQRQLVLRIVLVL